MKTKQIILIAFATLLFFGCKSIKEIQYIDRVHETIKTDSIYKYEKDTMTIKVNGDSTFITKWSTKIDYKFKYINKTDTVTKTNVLTKTITTKRIIPIATFFLFIFYFLKRTLHFSPEAPSGSELVVALAPD